MGAYDGGTSERTFMSGVLILTVSTVLVKIIGLAYKIPLLYLLGAEGMGYFNSAYEIYALLCGISTTGMPVAVSMLISAANKRGDVACADGVYRTSSALMISKGVIFAGALAVLAEPISIAIGNHEAYPAILAISPALLFTCASGAVRGYFQGHRNMLPTAVSQLAEAGGKLVFGVVFAALSLRAGARIYTAAAMGILGVSLGSLLSALYLVLRKRAEGRAHRAASHRGRHFWELLRISLPITLSSTLMGASRLVDIALIMQRLQSIGISASDANKIYGSYTTLALPVFGLIPAFIPPITESLIPRLSAAVIASDREEQERSLSGAYRLTVFLAMPAGMGIVLYSEEIISLLFSSDPAAVSIAAPLLSVLGASVLMSCIVTTSSAVLQSYGRVVLPIIALGVGAVVKAVSAYLLIGNADVAALGAPISTLLFNMAVVLIDMVLVKRVTRCRIGALAIAVKPLVASVIALLTSYALYLPLTKVTHSTALPFLAAMAVCVAIYLGLCILMSVVSRDDVAVITKRVKK